MTNDDDSDHTSRYGYGEQVTDRAPTRTRGAFYGSVRAPQRDHSRDDAASPPHPSRGRQDGHGAQQRDAQLATDGGRPGDPEP